MPCPRRLRSSVFATLTLATLTLGSRPVRAQQHTADRLAIGARVRVTAPPHGRSVGTVLAYRGDTLVLLRGPRADTVRVALGPAHRLDVSLGTRRRLGRGVGLGLVLGAAVGGAAGLVVGSLEDPSWSGLAGTLGALGGASAGALGGAAWGGRRVEQWARVTAPRRTTRLQVTPRTAPSGPQLAVALVF
jgi:hypothetical protein